MDERLPALCFYQSSPRKPWHKLWQEMIAWEHLQMRGTFKPFTSGFLADLVDSIGDPFADFAVAVGRIAADAVVERTKCYVYDLSREWMSWLSRVPTGPIRVFGDTESRWRCEKNLGLHPTSVKQAPGSATMGS